MQLGRLALALDSLLGGLEGARGDETSARLVYQRDEPRCPDEKIIRAEVERRVGRNPFDDRAQRVIVCTVVHIGDQLRARIEVGSDANHLEPARELVSSQGDCDELAEAVLVTLSIAASPAVASPTLARKTTEAPVVRTREPAPAKGPPEVREQTEHPVAVADAAPQRRKRSLGLQLSAAGAVAAGLEPGIASAGSVGLGPWGEVRYASGSGGCSCSRAGGADIFPDACSARWA